MLFGGDFASLIIVLEIDKHPFLESVVVPNVHEPTPGSPGPREKDQAAPRKHALAKA